MPQFYETDNLQCWLRAVIQETYERYEDEEEHPGNMASWKKEVSDANALSCWGQEELSLALGVSNTTSPIFQAIMNSVDWHELYQDFQALFDEDEPKKVCRGCGADEAFDCKSHCEFKHSVEPRQEITRA